MSLMKLTVDPPTSEVSEDFGSWPLCRDRSLRVVQVARLWVGCFARSIGSLYGWSEHHVALGGRLMDDGRSD